MANPVTNPSQSQSKKVVVFHHFSPGNYWWLRRECSVRRSRRGMMTVGQTEHSEMVGQKNGTNRGLAEESGAEASGRSSHAVIEGLGEVWNFRASLLPL